MVSPVPLAIGSSPRMWGTYFFYPFDILIEFQRTNFYQIKFAKFSIFNHSVDHSQEEMKPA